MTSLRSNTLDNGGRCESCNRPESKYETQQIYPVYLGGYAVPVRGTMWMSPKCLALVEERDKGLPPGKGKFTKEQLSRLKAIGPGF